MTFTLHRRLLAPLIALCGLLPAVTQAQDAAAVAAAFAKFPIPAAAAR